MINTKDHEIKINFILKIKNKYKILKKNQIMYLFKNIYM